MWILPKIFPKLFAMYQPPLPPPPVQPAPPPPPPPPEEDLSPPGVGVPSHNYSSNESHSQSSKSLDYVYPETPAPYASSVPSYDPYQQPPAYGYEGYAYNEQAQKYGGQESHYQYQYPASGSSFLYESYKYPDRYPAYSSNYRPPSERQRYTSNSSSQGYHHYPGYSSGRRYEQRHDQEHRQIQDGRYAHEPRHGHYAHRQAKGSQHGYYGSAARNQVSDDYSPRGYHERERNEPLEKTRAKPKVETERDRLLRQWCSNFCEKPEDYVKKMNALSEADAPVESWVRSSPAELYYERTKSENEVRGRARLQKLCTLFDEELLQRAKRVREKLPVYVPPPRKARRRVCKHKHKSEACSSSSSSDDDSDEDAFKIEQDCCMEELSRKVQHPQRVHADLWHNDAGEMNDGPLCRCSAKSRRIGIRHGIYPGETGYKLCDPNSNNAGKLFHYRISISPPTNFLTKTPTIIKHDEHEFLFEGFSLLSHVRLSDLPVCKVIRFNIEYTIEYEEEKMPENFTIHELDIFCKQN